MGLDEELAARHAVLDHRPAVSAAEAAVVTWRWSRAGSGHDRPYPLACERDGARLGRLTASRPGERFLDQDHVGLDGEGRVTLVRAHDGAGGRVSDTVLTWTRERIEVAHWTLGPRGAPPAPSLRWIALRADGLPDRMAVRAPDGTLRTESYERDADGRLTCVRQALPAWDVLPAREVLLVPTYDTDGRLLAVDRLDPWPTTTRTRVWRVPPDRAALRAWRATVEERLPSRIRTACAQVAGSVGLLALQYDEQALLLGVVALPAEELGALAAAPDPGGAGVLTPAMWTTGIELDLDLDGDPELRDALASLDLELRTSASTRPAADVLGAVAAALNADGWPGPGHPDRLAFATDLTQERLAADVRRAVPAERVRDLRRRGWI